MKYLSFLILIFLLCSCFRSPNFNSSKSKEIENYRYTVKDTVKDTVFPYQEELQDYVDQIQQLRPFNLDEEIVTPAMLETKEDMASFYGYIMGKKAPEFQWSNLLVSEDRTKKIWFASARLDNSLRKTRIHLVVVKQNCKILVMIPTR